MAHPKIYSISQRKEFVSNRPHLYKAFIDTYMYICKDSNKRNRKNTFENMLHYLNSKEYRSTQIHARPTILKEIENVIKLTASLFRASSNSLSRRCSYCFSRRILLLRITSFSCRACSSCTAIRRSCCDWRIKRFTSISSRRASYKGDTGKLYYNWEKLSYKPKMLL